MSDILVKGFYHEGEKIVGTKAPLDVPIAQCWEQRKLSVALVNLANRRKLRAIIVGTGLAGGAAAASLGEMGYNVDVFFYQDSACRAHSIAAQGGTNAVKNHHNDSDSVYRLFYDTVKDGDYRACETNIYCLAEVSVNIIDQCVAQGVPFVRECDGLLDNRSFGGVQVSCTFYACGQTGQQFLTGVYQALERQVAAGTVTEYACHEVVELIVSNGRARGIAARDMSTGKLETHVADAVVLATGSYGNVFFLPTSATGCNAIAIWRTHCKGAYFGSPCFTQTYPTCTPQHGDQRSKLTLTSESLRNDGRIWMSKKAEDCEKDPREIPKEDRDYYLERIYPLFGNLVPCDIAPRQTKNMCDEGQDVGPEIDGIAHSVYLDFADVIQRMGKDAISAKYGNLFGMYERITGDNPYEVPMRIYPAVHYAMDGLWVDYDLESNLPGPYVVGEANFSDHDVSRLGASVFMQSLSDGYFVLPNTINDHLSECFNLPKLDENFRDAVEVLQDAQSRIDALMSANGSRSVDSSHKESGYIMWEHCGMEHTEVDLKKAIGLTRELRKDYWLSVRVPGKSIGELNQSLEKVGRVADFMELGELMCIDALHREESCGGHFRAESQTPEGEAMYHGDQYLYVAAWEWVSEGEASILHKEDLIYNDIELKQRSYK